MKTYIVGPGGVYFSAEEAFLVRVSADNDEDFNHAMDFEDIDDAWEYVSDSIPGPDFDDYIPWGNPEPHSFVPDEVGSPYCGECGVSAETHIA